MQLFVRRRVRFPWSQWFVIACLAMLLAGARPASAAPILRVSPSSTDVTAGGIFSVDFAIDDVVDLYAFQFGISFNRGYPRYNPGEFSTVDVLVRGDCDAVFVIGADPGATMPQPAISSHLPPSADALMSTS